MLRKEHEGLVPALFRLVAKSRRRYGGYIVHIGMVLVFIHFTGRAWGTDIESSIEKGGTLKIDEVYSVRYLDSRMENDTEKRSVISDIEVYERGKLVDVLHPAQNIYKSRRGESSTEIARHITLRDDLYVSQGSVDPKTKIATFHIFVNPFAVFLVIGGAIMILGAILSLWPDVQEQEVTAFSYIRAAAGVASTTIFFLSLVFWPKVSTSAVSSVDPGWLTDSPALASPE